MNISRRTMMAASGAVLASPVLAMPQEGAGTPHLCLIASATPDGIARIAQLGISHVILGGVGFPWDADDLKARVKVLKDGGLTVGDVGIPWSGKEGAFMRDIIYGRPGRDAGIEKVNNSIRAAGAAGIPVIEYNFYAHRLEEGYFDEPYPARGGAVLESFRYDRVKDLPPLPEEGTHSLDEIWTNIAYFLKAVVPVAEGANVRLALHPNDPPAPISRGSQQIMSTLDGWKKLIGIVDSPANCITFDCGVTRELGEDPVSVARYFGSRDRIGHVHYRNVLLRTPRQDYTEVYPDMGDDDMLAVMEELVRQKYSRLIYPEHARGLTMDRDAKNGDYAAWAFHVGYARAMLQAALELKGRRS
ncbi:MAG TPA: mannonate dehydratase [Rhizomicrobium sp.]|nr:mannonate dehydratase [Rhizomicrobium sp.]